MLLTNCLIIILLAFIVWQDFAYRAIYWFLLPLLAACFLLKAYQEGTLALTSILFNLGIVGIQIGILSVYVYTKNKKWNLYSRYLGLGDVLFFCALAFYFSPLLFLGFQITSLLLTLVIFMIFHALAQGKHTIPLAGCQAALLILLITLQSVWGFSDSDIHSYLSIQILGYEY